MIKIGIDLFSFFYFTKFHPKHSLRQVNCKGLLKISFNKVREQKKIRITGLGHQATWISKTYSLASWKNLSCRPTGLGNKKMEADSTNDLCEQKTLWATLSASAFNVNMIIARMLMDWLCEYFWRRLWVWEHSHLGSKGRRYWRHQHRSRGSHRVSQAKFSYAVCAPPILIRRHTHKKIFTMAAFKIPRMIFWWYTIRWLSIDRVFKFEM